MTGIYTLSMSQAVDSVQHNVCIISEPLS